MTLTMIFSWPRTLGLYTTLYLINKCHGGNTRGIHVIFTSVLIWNCGLCCCYDILANYRERKPDHNVGLWKRNYLLRVHLRCLVYCVVCLPLFGAFCSMLPASLHCPFWINWSLFLKRLLTNSSFQYFKIWKVRQWLVG